MTKREECERKKKKQDYARNTVGEKTKEDIIREEKQNKNEQMERNSGRKKSLNEKKMKRKK